VADPIIVDLSPEFFRLKTEKRTTWRGPVLAGESDIASKGNTSYNSVISGENIKIYTVRGVELRIVSCVILFVL
jgi:hypothetical protein